MKAHILSRWRFLFFISLPLTCLPLKSTSRRDLDMFNDEQMQVIHKENIRDLLSQVFRNKNITFDEPVSFLDYALQIKNSGFGIGTLEPRVNRYIKKGSLPFSALSKAIDREEMRKWRIEKMAKQAQSKDPFIKKIVDIKLKKLHQDKILEIYALCVDAFRDPAERARWLAPKVCPPIPGANKPQNHGHGISLAKEPDKKTPKSLAYNTLLQETALVAESENLTDFEKIKMAKCISEHALHFFSAYSKPLKALKRVAQYHQAPVKAFFAQKGICGNFSAIAFNIANALGLQGRVFMANHRFHTYLEFQSNGQWFHTHPFNSTANTCDVIEFPPQ